MLCPENWNALKMTGITSHFKMSSAPFDGENVSSIAIGLISNFPYYLHAVLHKDILHSGYLWVSHCLHAVLHKDRLHSGYLCVSCCLHAVLRKDRMQSGYLCMTWTTLHQNITKRIRTRALGALTGVSSGSLTAILTNIKIHFKPYHKAAQQIQINSKKNL